MFQLLWPLPALLATALCVLILRRVFALPGAWREIRSWFVAALVVVCALLGWRASWRFSPLGLRERLEQRTGLDLPFWPRDSYYFDNGKNLAVAHVRLTAADVARLPPGVAVSRADAEALLAAAAQLPKPESRIIPAAAELQKYDRCELGWYTLSLVDRTSGNLWATLFYADSEATLPCFPD